MSTQVAEPATDIAYDSLPPTQPMSFPWLEENI
jgi:hypothetical protein